MLKAVRCLEIGLNHLEMPELKALSDEEIHDRIKRIDDERCFVVAELSAAVLLWKRFTISPRLTCGSSPKSKTSLKWKKLWKLTS